MISGIAETKGYIYFETINFVGGRELYGSYYRSLLITYIPAWRGGEEIIEGKSLKESDGSSSLSF